MARLLAFKSVRKGRDLQGLLMFSRVCVCDTPHTPRRCVNARRGGVCANARTQPVIMLRRSCRLTGLKRITAFCQERPLTLTDGTRGAYYIGPRSVVSRTQKEHRTFSRGHAARLSDWPRSRLAKRRSTAWDCESFAQ